MNLLNMLTKALTSSAALEALSAKTGLSKKQLAMIITIAVPLLIRKMTSNASSQDGANSLLGALTQHQNRDAIDAQLKEADEEDGAKIIGHILGEEQEDIVATVAKEADISEGDVSRVLGNISPSILSGLSAATQSAHGQQSSGIDLSDGFDMKDILGLLGGAAGAAGAGATGALEVEPEEPAAPAGIGGLLSSIFGGGAAQSAGAAAQPAGGGMDILSGLLGTTKPEEDQSVNGNQLISTLLSLM